MNRPAGGKPKYAAKADSTQRSITLPQQHIELRLPWPPTGNHMYTVARGRKILSGEGRAYRDLGVALASIQRGGKVAHGRLSVHITANVPDRRKRDLDNLVKMPIDCANKAGCFGDDSQIDSLTVVRGDVTHSPNLVVRIEPMALRKVCPTDGRIDR